MKRSALFFILLGSAIFAWGQSFEDSSSEEDVIVVTAGKIEQSVSNAVEKIQVVTSEDIKKSGAKTLTEAVKSVPGVSIKGAAAGNPVDSISMQGFYSDYVKILVDGIAVSGDIGGATAVFQVPVEDIERIEIIQGASSALYGSDAMGGVINIITKKVQPSADKIDFKGALTEEFTLKKDNDWRNYASANFSFGAGRICSSVSGSFDYTPGKKDYEYYAFAGKYVSYYETPFKRMGFVRASVDWKDSWGRTGFYTLFSDAVQKSNFSAVGFDSGSVMEYKTDRIEAGLSGEYKYSEKLCFSGFSSVKGFLLSTDFEHFTSDSGSGFLYRNSTASDSNFIDWESELRSSWNLNELNFFLFGFNANLQTVDGDSFEGREKQLLLSSYAQDTITFLSKKICIVPGVRFDYIPEISGNAQAFMVTPKLSVKYSPVKDSVIRFSYGMGYKTPTLKQKFWSFYHNYAPGEGNFILNGNPDLESEKSQSFNLSFEQNVINLFKISVSGYFNYIIDMIDSEIIDKNTVPQTRSYINVGKAVTYGGDFCISADLDRFSFKGSYAYTGAKSYVDGCWEDLSLRVTHKVFLSLGYMIPLIETEIVCSADWSSRQLTKTGGNEYTPDYLMICASASKKVIDEKLEIYLRADNLLNNLSFIRGTDGSDQESYYNLHDGTTFSLGAGIKL